jgi:uncharacterized membrane protein
MTFLDALRAVHVIAGTLALLTFWLPMAVAKGGRLHRRVGWAFVGAMGVICVTGLVLSGWRLATESWPGVRVIASFLGYLSILTGAGAWKGVRVLRRKRRTAPSRHPLDLGLPLLAMAAGAGVTLLGLWHRSPLLLVFGPLGALGAFGDLTYWLRPPDQKRHFLLEHIGDMCGVSIAALTAFLVQMAPRLGLGRFSLLVWLGPSLIGVPVLMLWQRRYRRRLSAHEVPRAA